MGEIIVNENGRNRVKIKSICIHCNKEFLIRKSWLNKQKYCSKQCVAQVKSNNNSVEVKCSYCQNKFRKKKSSLINSKSGFYFCTREHKDLAQRLNGIKEIQPSHYGSKRTDYKYRDIAFSNLPNECNNCGYSKYKEILVVHHKDRNRKNNIIENLEILCPNCHSEEHYLNSDGMWTKVKLKKRG